MIKPLPFVALSFLLGACAAHAGTHPHDMSAAGHRQAAAEEQALAQEEASAEPTPTAGCGTAAVTDSSGVPDICWSVTAETRQREQDVARHRAMAAKHRAAAVALEKAEATACQGMSARDRDISPFFHQEDILSVREVRGGAVAIFRPVPGLTVSSLQRLVNCHMARAAAVGNQMPEMDYCPLVLRGVRASVANTDAGLAVTVTSDDPGVAAQILRRASRNGKLWRPTEH